MLSKSRIIKGKDTVVYDMPSFERRGVLTRKDSLYFERMAEVAEKDGYEKGYAAGEKAGLEMGEKKADVLLTRLEGIIREIGMIKEEMIKELEPQILDLSVSIARKIILEELTVNPDSIVRIVKEAINRIERTGQITIKINPSLQDLFRRLRPELLELHPDIVFDIDPSTSSTGPLVIGPFEEVITDMDDQLKNMMDDIGGGIGPR